MITEQEMDLLLDLAKLLRKHGPETFESLADSISSRETSEKLAHLLRHGAKIAASIPTTKRRHAEFKPEPGIPKALITLRTTDPEKYQTLMNFRSHLIARVVLPSLREVREFAKDSGLPEVRAKSRKKAIAQLIGALAKLPSEQLTAKMQLLKQYGAGDRSLEGWSKVILNGQDRWTTGG